MERCTLYENSWEYGKKKEREVSGAADGLLLHGLRVIVRSAACVVVLHADGVELEEEAVLRPSRNYDCNVYNGHEQSSVGRVLLECSSMT